MGQMTSLSYWAVVGLLGFIFKGRQKLAQKGLSCPLFKEHFSCIIEPTPLCLHKQTAMEYLIALSDSSGGD